ncbi:MAG: DUF1624 domain-containing protein [Anaerolineae bacterium]|nr:DUF1624 domain-containing protein [Anaerolineae bacterium]MBT7071220.1 DUF1624 domain-containing protein [Anaerolineae bacterium]MBT7324197.1 DUF1624 domain-containing protein [Anaerolineae bacterium]
MPTKKRDYSLDILKGIGCLMMVVAHSNLGLKGYRPYAFYAGLAPVLFFAVSGVTASFQSSRYRPRSVLFAYFFLLLLGFSYNRITDVGFLEEINFDIIQLVAAGAVVIYLIEYYFDPPLWLYPLLAGITFALKFFISFLVGGRTILGFTGVIVAPGIFPIFPWLFLFFLGVFTYRTKNLYNLLLAILLGAFYILLPLWGFDLDIKNKWNMSVGYFLLSSILVFISFFIIRTISLFQQRKGMQLPIFLGKYSLLFLYIHFPLVLFLKSKKIHHNIYVINQNPYLFWLLILSITILIMLIIIWIAKLKRIAILFDSLTTWIIMIILIFSIGLFVKNVEIVYWLEIGLGILFAVYYPALTNLLKKPRTLQT